MEIGEKLEIGSETCSDNKETLNMPYIELTRGQSALVDADDFEKLKSIKWHAHKDLLSGKFRAYRHVIGTRHKTQEMSYFLMGTKDGFVLDHKNRNILDYRKENLRWATTQENCRNRLRTKKSGLPQGVFKNSGRFTARIGLGKGIRKTLGTFLTPEVAFAAYVEAANNYFGEFSPYKNVCV